MKDRETEGEGNSEETGRERENECSGLGGRGGAEQGSATRVHASLSKTCVWRRAVLMGSHKPGLKEGPHAWLAC